jgi:APA family basic amino acid/polyamine antiporter
MIIGLDVYLAYGVKHSALSAGSPDTIPQGNKIGGICGLSLSVILAIVAFVHHSFTPDDAGIFYFSLAFAALHAILFGVKMAKK